MRSCPPPQNGAFVSYILRASWQSDSGFASTLDSRSH